MKTLQKLYRPVGLKELILILETGGQKFPPRLPQQPIFYPVLNFEYAAEIAEKWNTVDEVSSFCGFVTSFELPATYLKKYEVQNVGGGQHNELWVYSEDLEEFNANIQGKIEIESAFYGQNYTGIMENTTFFQGKNAIEQFEILKNASEEEFKKIFLQEKIAITINLLYWNFLHFETDLLTEKMKSE